MRSWIQSALAATASLCLWAASAVPAWGVSPRVCAGPASARNPHCQEVALVQTPWHGRHLHGTLTRRDDAPPGPTVVATPEPGSAALFALGAALVATRARRRG